MRFHALGLPHTVTRKDYSACAFTQKVLKFCKMMHSRGHTVYHYGHEDSTVECFEHISVITKEDLVKAYGHYDWKSQQFKHSTNDHAHLTFNMKAAEEISKRKKPGDILLLFWGSGHAHVGQVHSNDMIVVEPGIGSFNKPVAPFCVFESYAVMHYIYGKYEISPKFMDCVIPNYFDLDDFSYDESENLDLSTETRCIKADDSKQEFFPFLTPGFVLFIGRIINVKGLQIAVESCKALGLSLIVAGQGKLQDCIQGHEDFIAKDAKDFASRPSALCIGYVEPEQRKELMHKAMCLMCPTLYAEPFGGVNVEAQLCGLPVISTDWGAFPETVEHGVAGYRCRTMDHFQWALKNVKDLCKKTIRDKASKNYSLHRVASMYEEYFAMLKNVHSGKGFYAQNEGRLGLSWLQKK